MPGQSVLSMSEEVSLFQLQASEGNSWTVFAKAVKTASVTDNTLKNRWYGAQRRVSRALSVDTEAATAFLQRFARELGEGGSPTTRVCASVRGSAPERHSRPSPPHRLEIFSDARPSFKASFEDALIYAVSETGSGTDARALGALVSPPLAAACSRSIAQLPGSG